MGQRPARLKDYPLRRGAFRLRYCPRIGQYRLAELAERFGAEVELTDVLPAAAGGRAGSCA